ncbi:uncharacterized protein LOC134695091 [Mytilus trossulus]|uniref:uncharacterized protein LOC134695091 n=1 Tax=Mytilus trossulus TaxID=6551 RepID=UPI003004B2FA
MAFQVLDVTVLMTILVAIQDVCFSKNSVTYSFPNDACDAPTYVVDKNTKALMKFEGDLSRLDCTHMSFTTPKSVFYRYRMLVRQLHFDSPQCQSMLYYNIYVTQYSDTNNFNNNGEIKGKDCNTDPYPEYNFLSNWIYYVDYVSFEVKKNVKQHDGYNKQIKIPHEDFIPDKLNDTFTFEIKTKVEYHYDVIAGVSGGAAGFLVLCGLIVYWCICCRQRKKRSGRYCCACVTNRPGNINAGGLSAECSVSELLLCSCILCRPKNQSESVQVSIRPDMDEGSEPVNSLTEEHTAPLIQCE